MAASALGRCGPRSRRGLQSGLQTKSNLDADPLRFGRPVAESGLVEVFAPGLSRRPLQRPVLRTHQGDVADLPVHANEPFQDNISLQFRGECHRRIHRIDTANDFGRSNDIGGARRRSGRSRRPGERFDDERRLDSCRHRAGRSFPWSLDGHSNGQRGREIVRRRRSLKVDARDRAFQTRGLTDFSEPRECPIGRRNRRLRCCGRDLRRRSARQGGRIGRKGVRDSCTTAQASPAIAARAPAAMAALRRREWKPPPLQRRSRGAGIDGDRIETRFQCLHERAGRGPALCAILRCGLAESHPSSDAPTVPPEHRAAAGGRAASGPRAEKVR